MSEQQVKICPQCGAEQDRPRDRCWLCGSEIPLTISESAPASIENLPETSTKKVTHAGFSFSLATLLLLMTLASVCLGLIVAEPGLGVIICVLLVPVLVRTARVVHHRRTVGVPVTNAQKVALFLGSFGVASVLATVICAAAFSSFCGVCLLMVSTDRKYGGAGTVLWGLGMCALAAGAIWMTFLVFKWIRRRYRRDMDRD